MADNQTKLNITEADFKYLKSLYAEAIKNNRKEFTFQGLPILTSYTNLLCQILNRIFKH